MSVDRTKLPTDIAMDQLSGDTLSNDMHVEIDYEDKPDVAIITDDVVDELEAESILHADDFEALKKRFFVDLPDHEVEYEASHTWNIEHWKSLDRKERGPVFSSGPHPWRILFFPFGNNVDCVSLYLEQGFDGKGPPEDWYACVQFTLILWNPNDPTMYTAQVASHRFTAEEGDWGFTRFIELRRLFTPHWDDRDRPLVENGSANISACVRVHKDPTGVLWHNFISYDSKKETGMVGLKNQGATCYLNSLLQSLYFTNAFRKAVYQIPTEDAVDSKGNSAYALQRLFYQLQTNNGAVSTQELTAAFGWTSSQIFDQQDVQELSRKLMERLEERMKGTEAENALARMFAGKMKTYISCINVDYESSRIEEFWDIQLNVRGNASLDESFKDYVQVETLDGENKYFAEGHGLQDAKKGVIFTSFPEVLNLQLKRFEYDINRDAMMKINDRHEFPEIWDASPYLSEDADRSEPYIYHLHGVLVHSGELNAGHYYAFLKPFKNGTFFKFDDERVTRATNREALEENYGGEYRTQSNGVVRQRNPYTRNWSAKRSMSAYMLVYLRESRLDKILCDDIEPPAHLATRIAEERAQLERRKKELEEAHLYMEIQVATDHNFKAHQGFDVVPWKVDPTSPAYPKLFRVARSMTVSEVITLVAREVGLDPDFCRPWLMAGRHNRTVRPDQPLRSLEVTIEECAARSGAKVLPFRIWLENTEEKDEEGRPIWEDVHLTRDSLPSNKPILLFLKYFDVDAQTLLGVTHFFAPWQDKVTDLTPKVLKIMGWPEDTQLKFFEEIKQDMIEAMKPKVTLAASEILDGDIITIQKSLSEEEIEEHTRNGRCVDVKSFYDYLLNRIRLSFMPKNEPSTEANTFSIDLSRRMSYDQFAVKVGDYLQINPAYLRFTTINAVNGRPKMPVKRAPNTALSGIMTPSFNSYGNTREQRGDALYYEVLEMSLSELETKKSVKIVWLSEGICKEDICDLLVPKDGVVSDIYPALQTKLGLSDEEVERIRLYEAHSGKIFKGLTENHPVASFNEFMTLYAELIPVEELKTEDACFTIACFHFDKEPAKTHNVPFYFVVKEGEYFGETKERLSRRTGIKTAQFQKMKFALIRRGGYSRPEYLENDDVLSEKIQREDQLGLDYPNKIRNAVFKAESIIIK